MKLKAKLRRLRKHLQSRSGFLQRYGRAIEHYHRIGFSGDKSHWWIERRYAQLLRLLELRAFR